MVWTPVRKNFGRWEAQRRRGLGRQGGAAIALELWEVDEAGLVQILEKEPPGLTVGRVLLADNSEALGVLAEPYAIEGKVEITQFGGWRAYIGFYNK